MTTFAVTSASSLLCHASTCFRMGSKFRCIRSTPTEMQSMSENDFECFREHRRERAIEGDVLMQISISSDLGTTPRNPAGVHFDGSSARRPNMWSRNGLVGSLQGNLLMNLLPAKAP